MENNGDAQEAISQLNGQERLDCTLDVRDRDAGGLPQFGSVSKW